MRPRLLTQGTRQDNRILASDDRGIIITAGADLVESRLFIQPDGMPVGRPDLKERGLHIVAARDIEQVFKHGTAIAVTLHLRLHTQVEHMAFTGADGYYAIANNRALPLHDPAAVPHAQTIPE